MGNKLCSQLYEHNQVLLYSHIHTNSRKYNDLLNQVDSIEPIYCKRNCKSSFNYYTINLMDSLLTRGELHKHIASNGIQPMVYYLLSLHIQEIYKYIKYNIVDLQQSEQAQEQVLRLTMNP